MTALPDWGVVSDAELAGAAAAGDRRAFAGIYDRYADRLHDFCIGMVRDRDAAADCVQDVFCAAATQLSRLRDPAKLRPWLYAIARNEALRCIRERRREEAWNEVPETESGEAGPETMAARTELADLVAQAAGGLSERDREVLDLAYRHGLDGPELAEALGVSPGNANQMLHRLRQTVERSLGALLVARGARANPNGCPELGAILANWDGQFNILMRKRVARHIESCPTCEHERRRLVNPVALLGGAPVFIPAPAWLRDHTLGQIRLTSASTPINDGSQTADTSSTATDEDAGAVPGDDAGAVPGDDAGAVLGDEAGAGRGDEANAARSRRFKALAAMFAAILIATVAAVIAWLYYPDASITRPTEVSATRTAPPTTTAAPLTIQAPPNKPPPPPPMVSTEITAPVTSAPAPTTVTSRRPATVTTTSPVVTTPPRVTPSTTSSAPTTTNMFFAPSLTVVTSVPGGHQHAPAPHHAS